MHITCADMGCQGDTESKNGSPDGSTPSSLELKAVSHSPKKAEDQKHRKKGHQKLHPDMIKRVEGGGVGLINPMGWYEAERAEIPTPAPTPEHRNDMPLPSGKTVAADGKDLSQALEAAVVSGVAQERQPTGEAEREVSEMEQKEPKTKLPEAEAGADVADEVSTGTHKRYVYRLWILADSSVIERLPHLHLPAITRYHMPVYNLQMVRRSISAVANIQQRPFLDPRRLLLRMQLTIAMIIENEVQPLKEKAARSQGQLLFVIMLQIVSLSFKGISDYIVIIYQLDCPTLPPCSLTLVISLALTLFAQ